MSAPTAASPRCASAICTLAGAVVGAVHGRVLKRVLDEAPGAP